MLIERYYDPQTISNIFAIGERIEWINKEWSDHEGRHCVRLGKGIIKHIRSRVVIIEEELPDGSTNLWRIERFYLSSWIIDKDLRKQVNKWDPPSHKEPHHKINKTHLSTQPHYIYTLSDPRNNTIYYVGSTVSPIKRLQQHIYRSDFNFKKKAWIQELLNIDLHPVITVIESDIPGNQLAHERETFWIQHYLKLKQPLTNIYSHS